MRPTGRRGGRGWPKSVGELGALEVSAGPRSAVGPAPGSAGTNPAEHHPRGRGVGLRRGAAWGRAGARRGAAQERSSVGLRRGAAAWGCAGARHGAVKGRSSVGLRRGAAWD